MTEKKFNVVFSGEVVQGDSLPAIKERMAALFKTSAANIDALFNQKNAVIKRNVDQETAQKYVQMIKKPARSAASSPPSLPWRQFFRFRSRRSPRPRGRQRRSPNPQSLKKRSNSRAQGWSPFSSCTRRMRGFPLWW
ncbi:MAG: hypothetical protein L7F78_13850 [Syntrophales bacterium LBB04]|nr:hypothetical protein [Syntrophales bacterium LBB04]